MENVVGYRCREFMGSKPFWLEEGNVFVVLLAFVMVGTPGYKIWFAMKLSRLMLERKIVVCQFGYPSSLPSVQLLWFPEVFQILVVSPDVEGIFGPQ